MTQYHNNLGYYFPELHGKSNGLHYILAHKDGQLLTESRCRQIITRARIAFTQDKYLYRGTGYNSRDNLTPKGFNDIRLILKSETFGSVSNNWMELIAQYESELKIELTKFDNAPISDGVEVFLSPFWMQSPPLFSAFLEIIRCLIQSEELPHYAAKLDNSSWGNPDDNWLKVGDTSYYWSWIDTTYFNNWHTFQSFAPPDYIKITSTWPKQFQI